MSTVTIDLRTPIKVTVNDPAGIAHDYDLKEGLNDVPPEVAEHWYVSKFTRPIARVPREVIASPQMSAAMLAKAADVAKSIEAAPDAPAAPPPVPAQTADVPAAKDKAKP